jgi:hypothetical protein
MMKPGFLQIYAMPRHVEATIRKCGIEVTGRMFEEAAWV